MKAYPLHPSPLTMARHKYRMTRTEAAEKLGMSSGQLKVCTLRLGPNAFADFADFVGVAVGLFIGFLFGRGPGAWIRARCARRDRVEMDGQPECSPPQSRPQSIAA
jgi:hypothetical protein